MSTNSITAPVVVIGGGPVGLSSALSLSRQGIQTVIIERNPGVTDHPKARGITARTMELFRQWGVEDAVRAHSFPEEAARFTWMTEFLGSVMAHVKADNSVYASISPTSRGLVSQDKVEEVLWNKINSDPHITVLREHEAKVLTQDSESVQIEAHNLRTGSKNLVTASYVIAADGAHSRVRESLGIRMSGGKLGLHCSAYCRMDLKPWLKDGYSVGFFIPSERGAGKALMSGNANDLWIVMFNRSGEAGERDKFTPEYCIQETRNFLGIEDLAIEVKSIGFWTMSTLVADVFRKGRVFLAGDAAHCVPPTGGYGMNIGIHDAHNLAWKLAYVLKGYADPKLLATYEDERKPQAHKIITWSTPNYSRIIEIYKAAYAQDFPKMNRLLEEQSNHLNSSGLDLGFHYTSAAVASPQEPPPDMMFGSYGPTSYPGFRAPHVWLQSHSGEKISTLDLFEREYVLLTAASRGVWEERVNRLKGRTRMPLRLIRVAQDGDYFDNGDFLSVYGLSQDDGVLVRPDGHIAWRSNGWPEQAERELQQLLA